MTTERIIEKVSQWEIATDDVPGMADLAKEFCNKPVSAGTCYLDTRAVVWLCNRKARHDGPCAIEQDST